MKKYSGLFVFLLIVAGAAWFAGSHPPGDFYASLQKPSWTPPDWVFAPAWTALYIMIAIAGWIVWKAQGLGLALFIWFAQLILNAAWMWLMFGQKDISNAMIDMAALWVAIAAFIVVAWPVRRSASLLFVPYFAWVTYAAALNFAILQLNS